MSSQIAPHVRPSSVASRRGHETSMKQLAGSTYLNVVNWAFVLFSSTRLLTYLPTLWAIHASGNSDQHSMLTWCAWVGSNVSMAAWLYENNGRRFNKAVAVVCGNSVMCLVTCLVILLYR